MHYGLAHFVEKYGISLKAINFDGITMQIKEELPEIFYSLKHYDKMLTACNGAVTASDIFKRIELILSGGLEVVWSKLDEKVKEALVKMPITDYYEEILFSSILHTHLESGTPIIQKAFWPNGKRFAVCLTHDVDEVRKTYQYITHPLRRLKKGDLKGFKNQFLSLTKKIMKKEEPYWTFEKIMDLEEKLGVRSTFYFLNEKSEVKLFDLSTWRHYGRRYDVTSKEVVEIMRKLCSEGWEVGLHGSFYSYNDIDKLKTEKETLERVLSAKVYGIRQHNLNLDIPYTWKLHEKIGLEYDTTLGFNDRVGFRWGTCFPFHPIDKETYRPMRLLEIPLTIEDIALFSYDDPWEVCASLINTVKKYGGVLTLLWHHSVFNELEYPGWAEIYERIIKVCKEGGAWVTNAYEIAKWWRTREESVLKCEYDGHTLKIKPYPRSQKHFIKIYLPEGKTLEVSSENAKVISEDENAITISTTNLKENGEIVLRM